MGHQRHHSNHQQQQYAYTPSSTSYNSNSLQIPSNDSLYGGSQSVQTPSSTAFSFGAAYASAASNSPFHGHSHSHHQHQPMTQPTTPVMSGHGHHHTFHPQHIKHAQSHHNVLYEHPPSHQQHHSFPDIDFSSAPLLCEDIVDEVFNELQLSQQWISISCNLYFIIDFFAY